MHRKQFIKNTTLAAASLAILPATSLFAANQKDKIKLVIIGVGLRGKTTLTLCCGEKM